MSDTQSRDQTSEVAKAIWEEMRDVCSNEEAWALIDRHIKPYLELAEQLKSAALSR